MDQDATYEDSCKVEVKSQERGNHPSVQEVVTTLDRVVDESGIED